MLGIKWTVDVIEGKKNLKQMAEFFGVTIDEAWEHVNRHFTREDMKKWVGEKSEDDFTRRMKRIVRVLEDYMEFLADEVQPDYQRIRALTQVVRELRGALMDYAELVGRIQRGQTIIQVQQIEQQVQMLTMVVLEECCEECKERILRRLETVMGNS